MKKSIDLLQYCQSIVNTIKLVSTVANVGGPNLDAISFTSDNLSAGGCDADCNGVVGGSAFLDDCSTCVGGNTGLTACTKDCNGDWGGTAYLDNCSACVGGNTGDIACSTTNTIELKAGWNLVGCPIEGSTDIDVALSSVWQFVEAVKSQEVFMDKASPSYLNSLQALDWGKGYYVKVSQNCSLVWVK